MTRSKSRSLTDAVLWRKHLRHGFDGGREVGSRNGQYVSRDLIRRIRLDGSIRPLPFEYDDHEGDDPVNDVIGPSADSIARAIERELAPWRTS